MTLALTNRMRIGFAVLAVLLTAVSVLGVGRLFGVREEFEDQSARYFSLQLEVERVGSAFVLEQSALAGSVGASRRSIRESFNSAVAASTAAASNGGASFRFTLPATRSRAAPRRRARSGGRR